MAAKVNLLIAIICTVLLATVAGFQYAQNRHLSSALSDAANELRQAKDARDFKDAAMPGLTQRGVCDWYKGLLMCKKYEWRDGKLIEVERKTVAELGGMLSYPLARTQK